jgi:hypothetical protein
MHLQISALLTVSLGSVLALTSAVAKPSSKHLDPKTKTHLNKVRDVCSGNTADDRSTWCDYDTSTDYYQTWPDTGVVRDFYFELTNTTAAPDGVERIVLSVNGTVPGPTIEANW